MPADHPRITLADLEGFDFGSVPEAADILRVDQRTVRKRIKDGTIPAVRMGTDWRVPVRWLREQSGAYLPAPGEPFYDVTTNTMTTWGESTPEQRLARERFLSRLVEQLGEPELARRAS
jgi:excisionase family DNA binding protein